MDIPTSSVPRFDYRIDANKTGATYWDPFTGRTGSGPKSALGYVPLEPKVSGKTARAGGIGVLRDH